MARVRLSVPDAFAFATEMPVRVSDVNYGGHLGNDALLALLQEARLRFLRQYGYSETDIAGVGLIMGDAVLVYRSQAFHGEMLRVELAATDLTRCGCDFVYRVTAVADGREIARAKTGMVFFDYAAQQVVPVPAAFTDRCAAD